MKRTRIQAMSELYNERWKYWADQGKRSVHIEHATHQYAVENVKCGDEVAFELAVEGRSIHSIGYRTKGCSICLGTIAFLAEKLSSASLPEAVESLQKLESFLTSPEKLSLENDWSHFELIKRYPTRVGCVLLPTKALLKIVQEVKKV